jgi:hypothetical protein
MDFTEINLEGLDLFCLYRDTMGTYERSNGHLGTLKSRYFLHCFSNCWFLRKAPAP